MGLCDQGDNQEGKAFQERILRELDGCIQTLQPLIEQATERWALETEAQGDGTGEIFLLVLFVFSLPFRSVPAPCDDTRRCAASTQKRLRSRRSAFVLAYQRGQTKKNKESRMLDERLRISGTLAVTPRAITHGEAGLCSRAIPYASGFVRAGTHNANTQENTPGLCVD